MTLNLNCVTLRYFTEFGKPVIQPRRTVHGRIYARVYRILYCVYDVVIKKFTFAISSPDEFLVKPAHSYLLHCAAAAHQMHTKGSVVADSWVRSIRSVFLANVNSRSRSIYVIVRPSVVCLSVVCNVGAPYSGN